MDYQTTIPMKPYLIRAVREWAIDNGFTPQVLVDATLPNVNVPEEFVSEGRIVLNIHDQAVQGLEMSNEWILFNARFSGKILQVDVPMEAVIGVFSRETQAGMTFATASPQEAQNAGFAESSEDEEPAAVPIPKGKPHLRIVR